jgi:glycosyltransferase involved in cell wall biosynthesis
VLAATRSVPRVLTVHGPEDWTLRLLRWNLASATRGEALSPADRARALYLRFLQRPAYLLWLRRIERIITPSEYFAESVRPDAGRVPISVIANGIEQLPDTGSAAEPDPQRVLYVGRLTRVKGVHVLIEAVRRLHEQGTDGSQPAVRLDIVGDGEQRPDLESAAADLVAAGLVRFHGWQEQKAVSEAVSRAAAVVIPSLWPENFPTVALEALQLGRPLIASQVGGLPELVGPDNGVLVPAGDAARLAEAVASVVGGGAVRQAELGRGSLERAKRYGVEEFLDNIERCYSEAAR